MPMYEFACGSCGERFEELVGPHVGKTIGQVGCPECGAADVKRLMPSSYAPTHRQLTANQKRRSEAARGTDRGGAKQRFKQQRAAERRGPRGR